LNTDSALRLHNRLALSTDPQLLARIGTILAYRSQAKAGDPMFDRGIALIKQAINVDPGNAKWPFVLQSAEDGPQLQQMARQASDSSMLAQRQTQASSGLVKIGGNVAEANLMTKVDPVYPPLALQAHVSGTVEFEATIGTDGKIQNLQLVRGHPLLVNAAKQAVLQYVYKPMLMNGNPVTVKTEVLVTFSRPN
jgi:hypothetical protein